MEFTEEIEYPKTIQGLYYKYGKTSDDEIRKHLERIQIIVLGNKGVGSVQGYYNIDNELLNKIKEKPRSISHTFAQREHLNSLVAGLVEWKTIRVLVKSSSRFFLKPDIGEVLDQIYFMDIDKVAAIYTSTEYYEELSETEGEHFIIAATLFKIAD